MHYGTEMIWMKLSRKIGFALSGIHLLVFSLFVIYLHASADGQARLLWALWLPVDFPVSYTVIVGLEWIPDTLPEGVFLRTWLPHIVHGIFGTIWWFYLPSLVATLFSWLGKMGRSAKGTPRSRDE